MIDNGDGAGSGAGRRQRSPASIWVGVAFIVLGIIFILQTTGVVALHNWWALIILIPAIATWGGAISGAQRSGGKFTKGVAGSIVSGLMIAAVAVIFLFGLDWGHWWPIFIVLVGLLIILTAVARRD